MDSLSILSTLANNWKKKREIVCLHTKLENQIMYFPKNVQARRSRAWGTNSSLLLT